MPEPGAFAPVLQWGAWFLIMTVVMGLLARGRLRPAHRTEGGTVLLQQPIGILILGVVCVVFFAACAYFSYSSPTGGPAIAAGFTLFIPLGLYVIWGYFTDRYELLDEGIGHGGLVSPKRIARWSEIEEVRYGSAMKWFVIKLRGGTTLRLSALLTGLPAFATAILLHVAPDAIRQDSREVLHATAEGSPPSVWM